MGKNAIQKLYEFGQSAWLDYISRAMIDDGRLQKLIDLGFTGMTSNPTIFDKAISTGSDYDSTIQRFCDQNKSTFEIYDDITVKDIQDAADIFKPVYEASRGSDGYVSLEVNPKLAFKTQDTIREGKRLYQKVNRSNVMFKVPATAEGFQAVEELTASGINVNVTLIFSLAQYTQTVQAYRAGITRFLQGKGDASGIRSVASVFVSRIDTVCDKWLDELITKQQDANGSLTALRGRAAVANSARIYKRYLDLFSDEEFKQLAAKGAHVQRVLWGSTGTKNPAYSDIKYVQELIAKNTVNTMPEATFHAFLDHGVAKEALTQDVSGAQSVIDGLRKSGIDCDAVCEKLLKEGVIAFEKSFDSLLGSIEKKVAQLCKM